MLKRLAEKLNRMVQSAPAFDPAALNDPIALRTQWTPVRRGGCNFRTHKLVTVGLDRLEFRSTVGAKVFYLLFLLIGVGVVIGFAVAGITSRRIAFNMATIMPTLIGLVFAGVGGALFYFGTIPIVVDTRKGYFWKGRKAPDEVFNKAAIKHCCETERIHALQLISEYCRSDKSSYYSYELNLVLDDGSRINVVDHGNKAKLREDAERLASVLGKPVWDAI